MDLDVDVVPGIFVKRLCKRPAAAVAPPVASRAKKRAAGIDCRKPKLNKHGASKTLLQTTAGKPLTVGTDCSGWESIIMALRSMSLDISHIFACDDNRAVKKTILLNHKPRIYYDNIENRDPHSVPCVDIYHAGFPCQPFSLAGLKLGKADPKGRGSIVNRCLNYVQAKHPKIVLFENVKGLKLLHPQVLSEIEGVLKTEGYTVTSGVLNAKDHGVPQNRERLFILGIMHPVSRFQWPKPITTPPLRTFLDHDTGNCRRLPPKSQSTARRHVQALHKMCCDSGVNLSKCNLIADVDGSKLHVMNGISPCLTASRAACGGHWLLCRGRRMTTQEMQRFQGISVDPPNKIGKAVQVARPSNISDRQWGRIIGNAIPLPLLQRILCCALPAAGLFGAPLPDLWS